MTCVPFDHVGAEPVFEPLDDDRVRVTWTEPGARPADAMICEGVWRLADLAAAERGDADLDLAPVREWPLADRLAALRAERDQLTSRRDELVNQHPELKAWR